MNDFEEYVSKNWRVWDETGLVSAALGLGGSVGECQERVNKHIRSITAAINVDALKLELGDVLHYLVVLAQFHGLTLAEIAEANMQKLDNQYERRRT
jgi:NTP pyrophosphatase (non-canonical NTP hydrolase)